MNPFGKDLASKFPQLPLWMLENISQAAGWSSGDFFPLEHQELRNQKALSRKQDYAFVSAPKLPLEQFTSHGLTWTELMKRVARDSSRKVR
jgi:hypothetical protein